MKKLLVFLFCSFKMVTSVYSTEVKISFDPVTPIVDEAFRMIVEIHTQSSDRPYISFNPGSASVLQRYDLGTSMQTTIINGQISSNRIYRYGFDMVSSRVEDLRITEIKVELGSDIVEAPDKVVKIVRERAAPKQYFLRAEASKSQVYLGEGFNVDYYIYFRVPITGQEIQDFPKLNGFIKRFYMITDRDESVEENGVLYRRRKVYSARLFAEKEGTLAVDPIKLRIQYSDQPSSGSFSAFGFHARNHQTRTLQSEPLNIEVLPLPAIGVPTHFTGLVGAHEFKLNFPRDRFVANEAIDFSLEVSGPGALENMFAPKLFTDPGLEEFDIKSDFREINEQAAKKTFSYTYLAREPLRDQVTEVLLGYFDPEEKVYKEIKLELPEITISGTATTLDSPTTTNTVSTLPSQVAIEYQLLAPRFAVDFFHKSFTQWLRMINIVLLLIISYFVFSYFLTQTQINSQQKEFRSLVKSLKKQGLSYSALSSLFHLVQPKGEARVISDIIEQLELSEGAKAYFHSLLNQIERETFKNSKTVMSFEYQKKYFSELENNIVKVIDEGDKKFTRASART